MTTDIGGAGAPVISEGDLDLPLEVPEAGVTEILVHGVGGATPPAMLGEPVAQQVTGDEVAGMWRGADRDVAHDGDQRWHREAYSWGGLTSRAMTSALWLVLLPFALLNLAGWMALGRPRTDDARRPDWRIAYQQALVRVLALAATLAYVLFVAQVAMDLGAWQCTQVDDCRLRSWPRGVSAALAGYPARAVVLAAVVPLLCIAGLAVLTRQTTRLYEDYGAAHTAGGPAAQSSRTKERLNPITAALTGRRFWSGAAYADRLRHLHLISSVLLVATLLLAVANEGPRWSGLVRVLLFVAAPAVAVLAVCAGWRRARRWLDYPVARVGAQLLTYAFLVAAAVLAWLQPIPTKAPDRGVMPGMLEAFNALVFAVLFIGALHGLVAVSGRLAARRHTGLRLPRIPAPFIAVSVGAFLLFAVWTGVAVWAARWLSPTAKPQAARGAANHLVYPAAYQTLAQASFVGLVVVAILMLAVLLFRRIRRYPRLDAEQQAWRHYELPDWIEGSGSWQQRVRLRKWAADMAFWLELALGLASLLATIGAIAYALWFTQRWVGWTGTGRVVGAVAAFAAGLTLLIWLSVRTTPPERGRRQSRDWTQVAMGLLAFATGVALAATVTAPLARHFDQRPLAPTLSATWLPGAGLSSAMLTAIPIGAVLLVRRAIRDQSTRRLVGTAWDVATFWPRAFHPLAPPSYAERAVPELTFRVRYLLEQGHAVLLLGHSQGAVLAVATLAQLTDLPADACRRLSVITYGNPVANLYMRWFPRYVNRELVDAARRASPPAAPGTPPVAAPRPAARVEVPVVNYFRLTDPVGRSLYPASGQQSGAPAESTGSTGSTAEDRWLPDPPVNRYRMGYGEPRVRGHAHGGYIRQGSFAEYVAAEVSRLNELAR